MGLADAKQSEVIRFAMHVKCGGSDLLLLHAAVLLFHFIIGLSEWAEEEVQRLSAAPQRSISESV